MLLHRFPRLRGDLTAQREIRAMLLYEHRTNVAAPDRLVANAPSFIAAAATAYRHDLPKVEIHLLDAGHLRRTTRLPASSST